MRQPAKPGGRGFSVRNRDKSVGEKRRRRHPLPAMSHNRVRTEQTGVHSGGPWITEGWHPSPQHIFKRFTFTLTASIVAGLHCWGVGNAYSV